MAIAGSAAWGCKAGGPRWLPAGVLGPTAMTAPARRVSSRNQRSTAPVVAAASGGSAAPASFAQQWDRVTNTLVSSSSLPFSILVLPQVISNFVHMASGNLAALSVISWEGYLSSLMGNTLMCSHFADSGERHAMVVQLIGIANNLAVLVQMAWASCMPMPALAGAVAAVAMGVGLSLSRLCAVSAAGGSAPVAAGPAAATPRWGTWRLWQLASGAGGMAVVAQVLANTLIPAAHEGRLMSYLPGLAALAVLLLWFAVPEHRRDRPGHLAIPSLPGWASTLLFAVAPLPQLVRNMMDARSLEGLSVGTMLLALLGNSLMVPRALLIRDTVWSLGTCWACCAGWGQLLSLYLRHSPTTGLRYLDPLVFALVTGTLLSFCALTLSNTRRAHLHAAKGV